MQFGVDFFCSTPEGKLVPSLTRKSCEQLSSWLHILVPLLGEFKIDVSFGVLNFLVGRWHTLQSVVALCIDVKYCSIACFCLFTLL